FRTSLQRRRLRFSPVQIATGSYQLCKRRHGSPSNELVFHFTVRIAEFRNAACSGVHAMKGTGAFPEHPTTIPALPPVSRSYFFLVYAERATRLFGTGVPFRPLFLPRSAVHCSGA